MDHSTSDDETDLRVRAAQPDDLGAWQRFVDSTPNAGCMHHAGWYGVLRDAYRVTPHFWMATDANDNIHGILPLYHSRSLLTGSHISSLEDGALAVRPTAARILLAAARELRDAAGA